MSMSVVQYSFFSILLVLKYNYVEKMSNPKNQKYFLDSCLDDLQGRISKIQELDVVFVIK